MRNGGGGEDGGGEKGEQEKQKRGRKDKTGLVTKLHLTRYAGETANVLCMGAQEVTDELEVITVRLTHSLLVDIIHS